MSHLIPITNREEIFPLYQGTPIGLLLEYHNLDRPLDSFEKAQLLIGMCMDNRKRLHVPDNFAYIIRTGGGNLRYNEFQVSYTIAIGGVKGIALIAHDQCAMVNLMSKQESFVEGLTRSAGWDRQWAEEHFMHFAPMFEIGNETDFVLSEAKRLRLRYPDPVAPMMYRLEDNQLYLIDET